MVMTPHAGDWVEVRSKEEILATLDKNGRLDSLPFMPQMFQYCGQRFEVYKRAHKTCETISGKYQGRRLPHGIHLHHRCDGKAYGGCQAACLIFWKEAWLKPVEGEGNEVTLPVAREQSSGLAEVVRCTEEDVQDATRVPTQSHDGATQYSCQATELLNFTKPLDWWDPRQYAEDYTSGNASLLRLLGGFAYSAYYYSTLAGKRHLGKPGRWIYDQFQALTGGVPFPRHKGKLPSGKAAPTCNLNLQPGDLVRIKSYDEILATVDKGNMNRGLLFDAEMVPSCGQTARVVARVEIFVDEKTGYMRKLKTPAVILDNVYCRSFYSTNRMLCPRSIYSWWREIWLEKIDNSLLQRSVSSAKSAEVSTAE